MRRCRQRLARLLPAALGVLACTPTKLEVGPRHPASGAAAVAPLAPAGQALEESFDPKPLDGSQGHEKHSSEAHQHGEAAGSHGASDPKGASDAKGGSDPKGTSDEAARWTCSMHPEIVRAEPGNCPICGMKLVPMPSDDKARGSH